jgi:hypothetical protein
MATTAASRSHDRVNNAAALGGLGVTVGATVLGFAAPVAVGAGALVALTAGKIGHVLNGVTGPAPEKNRGISAADAVISTVSFMAAAALGAANPVAWGLAGGILYYTGRQIRTLGK